MPGYIPPPYVAKPLLITVDGQNSQDLRAGLDLTSGAGVILSGQPNARRILAAASVLNPPTNYTVFAPGALSAARTLAAFTNITRSGDFDTLEIAECNLGTPTSATITTAACANVHIFGAQAGDLVIPLNTPNASRFTFDKVTPTPVGGLSGAAGAFTNVVCGWLDSFTLPSSQTVTALNLRGVSTIAGVLVRVGILDANRNWLTQQVFDGSLMRGVYGNKLVTLSAPITLQQGAKYYIGQEWVNWTGAQNWADTGAIVADGSNTYTAAGGSTMVDHIRFGIGPGSANGGPTPRAGFGIVDAIGNPNLFGAFFNGGAGVANVAAKPAGLLLVGDITIGITLTGAPAGPGSDVNIRLGLRGNS